MSMYDHTEKHEHNHAFFLLNPRHLIPLVEDLVQQLVFIGTLSACLAFVAVLYIRAVVDFTTRICVAVQDEPV